MIRQRSLASGTIIGALLLSCTVPAVAQEHQHPQPTAKPAIISDNPLPTEKPVARTVNTADETIPAVLAAQLGSKVP